MRQVRLHFVVRETKNYNFVNAMCAVKSITFINIVISELTSITKIKYKICIILEIFNFVLFTKMYALSIF